MFEQVVSKSFAKLLHVLGIACVSHVHTLILYKFQVLIFSHTKGYKAKKSLILFWCTNCNSKLLRPNKHPIWHQWLNSANNFSQHKKSTISKTTHLHRYSIQRGTVSSGQGRVSGQCWSDLWFLILFSYREFKHICSESSQGRDWQ